jgi:hypothetical protein
MKLIIILIFLSHLKCENHSWLIGLAGGQLDLATVPASAYKKGNILHRGQLLQAKKFIPV